MVPATPERHSAVFGNGFIFMTFFAFLFLMAAVIAATIAVSLMIMRGSFSRDGLWLRSSVCKLVEDFVRPTFPEQIQSFMTCLELGPGAYRLLR